MSRPGGRCFHPVTAVLLTFGLLLVGPDAVPTHGVEPNGDPLRFRRLFAPADRVQDWPRGSLRYVPVEPEEFEQLIRSLSAPAEAGALDAPRPQGVEVQAQLNARGELEGTCRWTFVPGTPSGDWLLHPCEAFLDRLTWEGSDVAVPFTVDSAGRVHVPLQPQGVLIAHWRLAGKPLVDGWSFPLEWPPTPTSSWELDLPRGTRPTSDAGLWSALEGDETRARWRWDLGGRGRATLIVQRRNDDAQQSPRAEYRTAAAVQYSDRSLEIVETWQIDVLGDPLERVRIVAAPGLRLVRARLGETQLDWRTLAKEADELERFELQLPQPLRGLARTIRLEGVAATNPGQNAIIPRFTSPELYWRQGTQHLVVPLPHSVQQLEPQSGRVTKIAPLPEPFAGESFEIQDYAPDARVQWIVDRRQPSPRLSLGHHLTLAVGGTTFRTATRWQVDAGDWVLLRLDVRPGWFIDSVESEPPGRIADWNLGAVDGGVRPLTLRLATPLTATQPLRVSIQGRGRSVTVGQALPARELWPLEPRNATLDEPLLALSSDEVLDLRLEDRDELLRLEPGQLTAAEKDLLPGELNGVILRQADRQRDWQIVATPRRPDFQARVSIEATVSSGPMLERYQLDVVPGSRPLERLLIHWSHARTAPLRWRIPRDERTRFVARRLTAPQQTALQLPLAGETWEIIPRQPQTRPFALHVERHTAWDREIPVSLVALPEATQQMGTVAILATPEQRLTIESERLLNIVPADRTGVERSVQAAFRYQPSEARGVAGLPSLRLQRAAEGVATRSALIWDWHWISRYTADGAITHQARLALQAAGERRLRITGLAPELRCTRITVDGQPHAVERIDDALEIGWSAATPFPMLVLDLTTTDIPLRHGRRLQPPPIATDWTVAQRRWTVWTPEGFQPFAPEPTRAAGGTGWLARLLGPLAPAPTDQFFDPTDSRAWATLVDPQGAEREAAAQAEAILNHLERTLATVASTERTWSWWLEQLVADGVVAAPQVGVDSRVATELQPLLSMPLATRGLLETPLASRPWGALDEAGWGWIIGPHSLLLTTRTGAVLGTPGLLPHELPMIRLAASDDPPPGSDLGLRRESLVELQAEPASPWSGILSGGASNGFEANVIECVGDPSGVPIVTILHEPTEQAWRCWAFLVGLGVSTRLLRHHRGAFWACLGTACLTSLIVTVPWICITSSLVLGGLGALGLHACFPPRVVPNTPSVTKAPLPALATTTGGVLIGLLISASSLFAQPAAPAEPPPAYQVFIPVDDEGAPTGGRYQVPEEFYAELRRRAAARSILFEDWELEASSYRVRLAPGAPPATLEVGECSARFVLRVASAPQVVRIPFQFGGIGDEPLRGLIDGVPADLSWDAALNRIVASIATPGEHVLEVLFKPRSELDADVSRLAWSIPRMPSAVATIDVPPGGPALRVPSALGGVEQSEDRRQWTARLGPTGRLAIEWPGRTDALPPVVRGEQLSWLNLRPGSVVVDVRWALQVAAGSLRALDVTADARWRLLPWDEPDTPLSEVKALPTTGDERRRTWRLTLLKPVTDQVILPLSFYEVGGAGMGNIQPPDITLSGVALEHAWLALSVDPALEYDAPPQAEGVLLDTFKMRWGMASKPIDLVLPWHTEGPVWSLQTRPRPPRLEAQQATTLRVERDRVEVRYEAELSVASGLVLRHRVQTPPALRVADVSVLEAGRQRVARWAQDAAGLVTVFLDGPTTQPQSLVLRGSMPLVGNRPQALPLPKLLYADVLQHRIEVMRQRGVSVELAKLVQLESRESTTGDGVWTRPVASLNATGPNPAAELRVANLRTRAQVVQLTTIDRDASQWNAAAHFSYSILDGLADRWRIEIPAEWVGPFTVTPPMPFEVLEQRGAGRRVLVVYPPRPADREQSFSVVGALKFASGAMPQWPLVRPLDVEQADRYAGLSLRTGDEGSTWETGDLEPASPPQLGSLVVPWSGPIYRMIGAQPTARLRTVPPPGTTPSVQLCEVRVREWVPGGYQMLVSYDVDPAGLSEAVVAVPAGLADLRWSLDGRELTPVPIDERRWKVPLPITPLPQRIELLGAHPGHAPAEAESLSLELPQIEEWPIRHQCWTIETPAARGRLVAGGSPANLAWVRLTAWSPLLNLNPSLAAERLPDELRRWFLPWEARWRVERAELESQSAAWSPDRLTALDVELARFQRRFLNPGVPADEPVRSAATSDLDLAWDATSIAHDGEVVKLAPSSPLETLRLPRAATFAEERRGRWALAGGLVLATGILAWLTRQRRAITEFWHRWPHLVGVGVGLVWWLALTPSLGGLLVACGACMLSWRWGLRPVQEGGSSIVRVSVHSGS